MTEFHDAAWAAVPEGTAPEGFAMRRGFLLSQVEAGDRVLDMGCGDGSFAAELVRAGAGVTAVDASEEAVRRARARELGLDIRGVSPGADLPFDDASFDAVWAGELLQHVLDLAALLSELRRVLRPEGRLLATVPDHSRRALLALALSRRRFAEHFDPRSQHVRFFSADTLRELLEDLGFGDVEIRRAGATLLASAVRPALGRPG